MTEGASVTGDPATGLVPATEAQLRGLLAELGRWNTAVNLVAPSTLADGWTRHVLDSLQLLELAPVGARHWADLGSGAGFPGLVIAIAARQTRPQLAVTLVEADQRKAAFLRETARWLDVSVRILAERIETLLPLAADVVSARALAPLPSLWAYAARHLRPDGIGLFLKGASHRTEIAEATAQHTIRVESFPSRVGEGGAVLRVRADPDA